MNELDLVERIRKMAGRSPGIHLGIGDDCAIYRPKPGEDLLFTTDQFIEGVHFRPDLPAAADRRTCAGAKLERYRRDGRRAPILSGVAGRFRATARQVDSGFLSRAAGAGAQDRHGAGRRRPGACASKIHCRRDGVRRRAPRQRASARRRAAGRFAVGLGTSRQALGPEDSSRGWISPRALRGRATACIDISDGLALDLHRMCVASGVAAEMDHVPVARGATLERALHGGDDYELLFTLAWSSPTAPGDHTGIDAHRQSRARQGGSTKPERSAAGAEGLRSLRNRHHVVGQGSPDPARSG